MLISFAAEVADDILSFINRLSCFNGSVKNLELFLWCRRPQSPQDESMTLVTPVCSASVLTTMGWIVLKFAADIHGPHSWLNTWKTNDIPIHL